MEISIGIRLNCEVSKDDEVNAYVSCCPSLDVCSQGDTEQEATENLDEAIYLFLSSCYDRGTLNKVLKDCGFTQDITSNKAKPSFVLREPLQHDAQTAIATY